jgi:PII-like signaling protein
VTKLRLNLPVEVEVVEEPEEVEEVPVPKGKKK